MWKTFRAFNLYMDLRQKFCTKNSLFDTFCDSIERYLIFIFFA